MNGIKRALFAVLALFTAASMTACGGGGGGTTTTASAAVSQGVITQKGSVFVNGVEFSTAGAAIKINDATGTDADLKVGMVVKVRGTSDDATRKGTATQVEARDALEGTVTAVDATNKTITVMGQTVRIEDNVTRLNDDDAVKVFTPTVFQVNDKVEVHGFADDLGGIHATRVAKKAQGELEIKGFVANLGAASCGLSLTPNGNSVLTVNFTAGQLPNGTANGSFVQVKAAAVPSGTPPTATAASIKLEDKLGAAGEKVKVEGIVASGTADSFVVNGQQVVTSSATIFEGGLKSDFTVGSRVEAEGPLDATGATQATRIKFRSNIRIEADVTAFTSGTSLTVLGKAVTINQFTRINLSGNTLANGSHVEVRAIPDRDGNLIATRIDLKSPDTRAFLQGPVTAVNASAGTMSILGVAIITNGQTEFRASTESTEQATNAATFFGQVAPDVTVVKVRWRPFTSLTQPVEQVEIEHGR